MNQNTLVPPAAAPAHTTPPSTKTDNKGTSKVTWGLTIISAISLTLTLLGYGVALAVESNFGIPHQAVYASVSDLVGLSVYAMISMILGFGKISWQPLFEQAWPPSLIGAAGMFLLISCMIYFRDRPGSTGTGTNRLWPRAWLPLNQNSTRQLLGKNFIGSLLFGGVALITPFLMVGALMVSVVLIAIVPMLGMPLGQNYFQKFVVAPTNCVPVRTRDTLMKTWSAPQVKNDPALSASNCVTLFKDGESVASGRVIVATSNAIVLFDPASGDVRRVPIGELTVLPINSVQVANKP